MTSNGIINSGFVKDESPDLNQNTKQRVSGDDVTRRASYTRSSSSGALSLNRRLSQFTAVKYLQRFTEQQLQQLEKFSSVNYLPSHSRVYLRWLQQFSQRLNWERWLLLFLIALCIGLLAAFMKQCLQLFNNLRWDRAKDFAAEDDIVMTWVWNTCIGVVYIIISSFLVVFVHAPAVGSGVPEVISYLNGITIHGVFSLKNLVVKFVSLIFAVSSGLPTATQGPIIALGAIIGSGVGQFKSESLGFSPKWFSRFRNAEDRRTFTTAGVAAGVAAAFNAPIGGLLFAMEDLSTFWNKKLSWQTFFCCGIAACVANVINTAFNAFQYQGSFGLFSLSVTEPIQIHVLSLLPAVVLGVVGGMLGALFTRSNVAIVRTRKQLLSKMSSLQYQKVARMLETVVLVITMSCITTLLPLGFDCTVTEREQNDTASLRTCGFANGYTREPYNCDTNVTDDLLVYSEVATLMQGSGTTFLEKLTTRGTHRWLGYNTLLAILPLWFFMTVWTLGSAIAGGIFVPNMISGALYGRALGMGLVDLYAYLNPDYQWDTPVGDEIWAWLDPGVMAVIGAGSLLGGVTRLNLAVTVIIVEMSHDINLTVPVLIAIWVAKIVADLLSKPLYKYQLDSKSLPYLDQDPTVVIDGEIVNLELYEARDVMTSPVLYIRSTESLHTLSNILLRTSHSGFPIVKYDDLTRQEHIVGLITRSELYVLLCNEEVYNADKYGSILHPVVNYEEVSVDYLQNQPAMQERVRTYSKFSIYHQIFVNLDAYINRSVVKVDQYFSLYRTYQLFRTMGLRHLIVTDKTNRIMGIVTRKNLMAFNIGEKITSLVDDFDNKSAYSDDTQVVAMTSLVQTLHNSLTEVKEDEDDNDDTSVNSTSTSSTLSTTKF